LGEQSDFGGGEQNGVACFGAGVAAFPLAAGTGSGIERDEPSFDPEAKDGT